MHVTFLKFFCLFFLVLPFISNAGQYTPFDANTPGLPDDEKIRFIIGHDTPSLTRFREEVLEVNEHFPEPGGITLYTNLVYGVYLAGMGVNPYDEEGNLMDGFNLDTNDQYDFGVNVHNFTQSLNEYPNASLAIGLYISDVFADCSNRFTRTINAIVDDTTPRDDIPDNEIVAAEQAIDVMVKHLKALDRDVYLRIGYEFDSKDQCYNREYHIGAFRYIKSRIDALGATRIATVWQAAGWPRNEYLPDLDLPYFVTEPDHYESWYPGDDVVDYVALSTFYMERYKDSQWACSALNPELFTEAIEPRQLHERILDFAREKGKPVMIAEAAPQAYDLRTNTVSCIFTNDQQPVSVNKIWRDWYANFFKFVRQNRDVVRVVHYINSNWQDATTVFQCQPGGLAGTPECPAGYWGDHTLQENNYLLVKFALELYKPWYETDREKKKNYQHPDL